ncbi:MAG: DUF58 domain-containing protein [Phycisphaerae bacterium]|nr:DUF58 domain-containing protein [Phycisphaerae bacterium]
MPAERGSSGGGRSDEVAPDAAWSRSITRRVADRELDMLQLARALATASQQGRHRSTARGGSAEFYDFRAYTPGDPTRLIDWRLLGRTDRAYLRRYRQESQVNLVLVVDASESMRFAGFDASAGTRRGRSKLRRACELAAALAYLAVKGGDRVGLVMAGCDSAALAPASGWPAMHRIVCRLDALLEASRASETRASVGATENPLEAGLRSAESVAPRSGIVVAFSDALDDSAAILSAFSRLRFAGGGSFAAAHAGRRDVALVQVLADDEVGWTASGAATLTDPESGLRIETDLQEVAASYREAIGLHIAAVRRGLVAAGGRHVLATLSRDPIDVLRSLLGS